MQSISPASSCVSSSSVQSDLPVAASACSDNVWLWSPAVVVGWMVQGGGKGSLDRRAVKRSVWASARVEDRVPIWRVRGEESVVEGGREDMRGGARGRGVWWGR